MASSDILAFLCLTISRVVNPTNKLHFPLTVIHLQMRKVQIAEKSLGVTIVQVGGQRCGVFLKQGSQKRSAVGL